MGRDAEWRARVQRLLTGEIRAEDITRLFLWLRCRRST
jgi:hypothetical protein